LFTYRYCAIELDFAMNQSSYRLRSSSAGPRPSGPAETERLAQVVMQESMPGREPTLDDSSGWVPTHVVAAEAEMRVEVASGDTAVSPWGLSSSPHFNTITQQKQPSLSLVAFTTACTTVQASNKAGFGVLHATRLIGMQHPYFICCILAYVCYRQVKHITVCTIVQDCCKGRSNKYRKWHFWGSCRPETPEPINMKFGMDDYVRDTTQHPKWHVSRIRGVTPTNG